MSFLKCCSNSGSTSDDENTQQENQQQGKSNEAYQFQPSAPTSTLEQKHLDTDNPGLVPPNSTGAKPGLIEAEKITIDDQDNLPEMKH